jgi:hypothetical protein
LAHAAIAPMARMACRIPPRAQITVDQLAAANHRKKKTVKCGCCKLRAGAQWSNRTMICNAGNRTLENLQMPGIKPWKVQMPETKPWKVQLLQITEM